MEVTKVGNTVTVMVERTIAVGRSYHMYPTYGYMGIMDGVVEVLQIATRDDVDDEDSLRAINDFIESSYLEPGDEGYDELLDGYWVQYQYKGILDEPPMWLPLDLFLDHTLPYL